MVDSFTVGDVLTPDDFAGGLYCPAVYDEVRVEDVSEDSVTLLFVDVDGGVEDEVTVTLPELSVMMGWPEGCDVSEDAAERRQDARGGEFGEGATDGTGAPDAGGRGGVRESFRGLTAEQVRSAVMGDVRSRAMRNLPGVLYALRGQDVPFPAPGEELSWESSDFSYDDGGYQTTPLDGCCVTLLADARAVDFPEEADEMTRWEVDPAVAASMYTDGRLSSWYGFYIYDHVALLSCDDEGEPGTDALERVWDRPTVVRVFG